MALQRVGIQFDFNANTKQAQTNLNALEKTMARLETRMQAMGAAASREDIRASSGRSEAMAASGAFGSSVIDLKTPLRQTELLTEKIRKGKITWDEYGRAVKQNSAIVTQQLAMQTGSIENVRRAGAGFAADFIPNSKLQGISQIEYGTARMLAFGDATKAASQHIIDMGKNLAFSARQMTVSLTMPMAIVGGLAMKQFTDIDKQLTDISKVYDTTADDVEMSVGRIRNSMKELASELSRTQGAEIEDTLNIAQYYAQQGKTGNDLRESTVQASRLMQLGDVDIEDAQKTITTLTAVVGASTEELGKYIDYLNKVEDSTQLTMSDFAKTLPTIAPLVKTFIPDDTDRLMSTSASMMEAARRAGFEPKEASNAWKSMYGSFVRPTGRTQDVFAELTRQYGNEQDLSKIVAQLHGNPVDILGKIAEITQDWDVTDKGRLMTQLTGKYQLSRGLGIMQAMDPNVGNNAEALNRMVGINEELVNNPQALADNSKRQMDLIISSASTQMKQLKQDVQMMFADLGERIFIPVMDALGNVLNFARTVYQGLAELPGPLKDIGGIVAQLTFIAGPVLAAFAATKMLAGFAGRAAANFATAAGSATRMAASIMGVEMKGTGKLQSRDETIAKLQEKDSDLIDNELFHILEQENAARARSAALVEEKNANTRESIQLQRELNRAMTGTITPDGSPTKDAKKQIRKYKDSLNAQQNWNMAIKPENLGLTTDPAISAKRFVDSMTPREKMPIKSYYMGPRSQIRDNGRLPIAGTAENYNPPRQLGGVAGHFSRAGINDKTKIALQRELDKINSGIAMRRSMGERTRAEIDADIARYNTLTNARDYNSALEGGQPAQGRRRSIAGRNVDVNRDAEIARLKKIVDNPNYSTNGIIAGEKSFGIDSLERQKAAIIKAQNGSHIQQDKVMNRLMAEQNLEANTRRANTELLGAEMKMRDKLLSAEDFAVAAYDTAAYADNTKMKEYQNSHAMRKADRAMRKAGENPSAILNPPTMRERISSGYQRAKDFITGDGERSQQRRARRLEDERRWTTNTLRGGWAGAFRGHTTPRDVFNAQRSDELKKIKKLMERGNEGADVAEVIRQNELTRQDLYDNLLEAYETNFPDVDKKDLEASARRDLDNSSLPTTAALERERDMHMERMVQRADNLEKRQNIITERSGVWAQNISNAAMGIGLAGTLATEMLGIQNGLVDTALTLANAFGAIGMMAPDMMKKVVGSFATAGSLMVDRLDASKMGTWLGGKLGDTMGTTMSSRMSKAFAGLGSTLMTAVPYIAAAAAALLAVKGIWDLHRKDSEAYVQSLKEANKSAELHAELLGYVRKEQEDIDDMTYREATEVRAAAYRDNQDGRSNFIRQMADINTSSGQFASTMGTTQRINQLNAVLSQEAVRILNDGGTDADVRSMVDAALQAAGVNDPQVVEGVQIHFKDWDVTADKIETDWVGRETAEQMSGVDTARSLGDRAVNLLSGLNPFSEDSSWVVGRDMSRFNEYASTMRKDDMRSLEEAYRRPSETSKEFVNKQMENFESYINSAATEGAKEGIANKYIEMFEDGIERAENSGDMQRLGTALRQFDDFALRALENSESTDAPQMLTEALSGMRKSPVALQAVLGGTEQEDFETPTKAAEQYEKALKELEEQGVDVSQEMKFFLHNIIATAGGFDRLNSGQKGESFLGKFHSELKETAEELKDLSPEDFMKFHLETEDPRTLEMKAAQTRNLADALKNSPESFHKRFLFDIDVTNQESIDTLFQDLKGHTEVGMRYVAEEANRQFQDRQNAAFDQIRNETEAANKGIEAKQKASEKAFEARGKALDNQFKAENKALDKRHKEEQKAYDKQQREKDKEFDKRQRDQDRAYKKEEDAKKKEFNKQQEAERDLFDDSWDDRADSVEGFYDNAIKAIENQGKAEEDLEKMRQRNAERQRKRLEYLADMANTNIDINVAVAGGNLDEAARLANSAAVTTQGYYQDQVDAEAGYRMEDAADSRGNRIDALNEGRGHSMEHFGEMREDATKGFEDTQELAQEKKDEELQLARDIYEEKKQLEQEQYEEQKALEAERFAERQALEKERLQAEQEARREALAAEREMMQERHNAEREMIQETARQKEDGARRHFEATKRSLDMEMEKLLADIPIGLDARKQWIKDVEQAYANHGVYLNEDFAPQVNEGMSKAMVNSMEAAGRRIASDQAWVAIGGEIGESLREGSLKGFSGEQVAARLLFGAAFDESVLNGAERRRDSGSDLDNLIPVPGASRGKTQSIPGLLPGKAKGGKIIGPGTGTSDSIPAMLSNGEHVMTAAEVSKMGGHEAVERLRRAIMNGTLPGFAAGGGVGKSAAEMGEDQLNVQVSKTGTGEVSDGGVLDAVASDVSNMGAAFDSTITNTVAPSWQQFGDMMVKVKKDSIDPVLEGSQIALQEYANQTTQIMAANMNPAWQQFGNNLKMVKETIFDVVMTDMKAGISSLSSSIATAISNEIMPKWTEGSNHIQNMHNNVIAPTMQQTRDATTQTAENFGAAADMIGVGWGRVKENSAEPVRYTIGTVYNDGLVGMWNKVAEALDLEEMTPHQFSFADGGVMPGYTPGRDVHHFSSPTGGKLHLSGGEAIMRPEWTKAVGGPSAVAKMNSDAKSGRVAHPSLGYVDGPSQAFKEGGVVKTPGKKGKVKKESTAPAWDYSRGPNPAVKGGTDGTVSNGSRMTTPIQFAMWDSVRSAFPGVTLTSATRSFMTEGHPDNHNAGLALDLSPSAAIAKWIYENYAGKGLRELIFMPAVGHTNVLGGQDAVWTQNNHYDHVHWAMSSIVDPWSGGVVSGGPMAAWGAPMIDPKIMAAVNTFNDEKSKLKEKIAAHMDAGKDTVMNSIPGKVFTAFTTAMDKKIQAVMPMMTGASLGAYGLNHEDHIKEIIAAAHERGLPREAAKIAIATALVESDLRMLANPVIPDSFNYPHEGVGYDHTSVGIFQQQKWWGTTAERMNARASAGMFYNALMQFDWQSMDPGAAAQKVQVSAYPDKYATRMAEADALLEKVGGFDANVSGAGPADPKDDLKKTFKGGGGSDKFDKGGLAHGIGNMQKATIKPERVLSPRQTEAFERMVPAMDRIAAGGISESEYLAKNDFDRSAAYKKMIEKESQAKMDFTEVLEKITPIISQLTGHFKSQAVQGITGYANDLIKLDNDAARIDKVSEDIIAAITGITVPEINTDMQMNIGGNIYGDAQLNATLERWKQDIIQTVQMQQALAQQAIGGK